MSTASAASSFDPQNPFGSLPEGESPPPPSASMSESESDRIISLQQLPYDPLRLYESPLVELTQSAVVTFMTCPQKYVFRYLMRLVRRGFSIPLITGSAVHRGLEVLLDSQIQGPMDSRLPLAHAAIDLYYETLLEKTDIIMGLEDKLEHSRAQSRAILDAYWIVHGDDFANWKPLVAELKVRTAPSVTTASPIEDRMAGMIDGVIQDPEGKVWILEHKTRRSLGDLNINSLTLDAQALWYMILCRHVLTKRFPGNPYTPVGFLYDAIQKPQHRMNAQGFDNLRQRMYDAMIADPDKYFSMTPILVDDATIARALSNFQRVVRAIDNLSPTTVFQNLKACDDYGGCPYRPLCHNHADAASPLEVLQTAGIELFTIEDVHTELAERDTGAGDVDDAEKWSP